MRPEDIQNMLRAQPFQPFRVRLTSGKTYDIVYPHLTMVTRPFLVIAFADPESNGRWGDEYVTIPWPEVAGMEGLTKEGAVA
jgi:hypothetical protein